MKESVQKSQRVTQNVFFFIYGLINLSKLLNCVRHYAPT